MSHLFYVHIYAKIQIIIKLSLTFDNVMPY